MQLGALAAFVLLFVAFAFGPWLPGLAGWLACECDQLVSTAGKEGAVHAVSLHVGVRSA